MTVLRQADSGRGDGGIRPFPELSAAARPCSGTARQGLAMSGYGRAGLEPSRLPAPKRREEWN